MSPRPPPATLLPWALAELSLAPEDPAPALHSVAGDASNRRYFRARLGERNYILAHAPPETENNAAFVAVGERLRQLGVRVPALYAVDLQRGYLLQEDLGDTTLLTRLHADNVDAWYRRAGDIALCLAGADISDGLLPRYDEVLLRAELARFDTWFLQRLLGHACSAREHGLLTELYDVLVAEALLQPRVLVHRDFHSRNLMLDAEGALALIDFQDAVAGPLTYDPVSLLRDCYLRWPRQQVRDWTCDYRRRLLLAGHASVPDEQTFLRWFDYMGLQRHLKVLGTFARLYLRDGKPGYLADLPRVLAYVREVLREHAAREPVFARTLHWHDTALAPLLAERGWSGAP